MKARVWVWESSLLVMKGLPDCQMMSLVYYIGVQNVARAHPGLQKWFVAYLVLLLTELLMGTILLKMAGA